ncbi:MAG TPA: TRAP transporter large permease [Chloroflexota bacterium]|nr:TRAP transporter large permease [Chloroflexota bacterium]
MAPEVVGLLALAGLLALLALRVPVGLSMVLVATCGQAVLVNGGAALARLGLDTFGIVSNAGLSVIPMFVLMGMSLARAHLGADLFRFTAALLGNVRGALAMATIGASALFASVSGSAVATTLTMAVVTVPEMRRYRYDDRLSAPAAAVGGTLGLLLPPSGTLVLYGLLTQESIGRVLVAGALPGVLTAALLMLAAYLVARRNPAWAPRLGRADGSLRRLPGLHTIWVVPAIFALSMGGLYLGVFTPTEAGAVGACLAVGFGLATRRLGWGGLCGAVAQTVRLCAALFLILVGGTMFGYFLTLTRIPDGLARFVAGLPLAPPLIVGVIFLIYFVMGALMEEIAILVIMTPIVYPVVTALGYDGVWFGVMSIMMLLTGLLTPPVGLLSFLTSSATGVPLGQVYRGVTPFWITLILANALVILFPQIALFLPQLMRAR